MNRNYKEVKEAVRNPTVSDNGQKRSLIAMNKGPSIMYGLVKLQKNPETCCILRKCTNYRWSKLLNYKFRE